MTPACGVSLSARANTFRRPTKCRRRLARLRLRGARAAGAVAGAHLTRKRPSPKESLGLTRHRVKFALTAFPRAPSLVFAQRPEVLRNRAWAAGDAMATCPAGPDRGSRPRPRSTGRTAAPSQARAKPPAPRAAVAFASWRCPSRRALARSTRVRSTHETDRRYLHRVLAWAEGARDRPPLGDRGIMIPLTRPHNRLTDRHCG